MSLRPMLYATDVSPLLKAASSRNVSLVEGIVTYFRENLDDPDEDTLEMAREEGEQLLRGAYADEAESEDHVNIVSALAVSLGVQDEERMIADGSWKQSGWDEYGELVGPMLPPTAWEKFAFLTQRVRPLFGSEIESDWSYYGYLLLGEVKQLRTALEQLANERPEIASSEFHNEFVGWLRQAEERNSDMWLFAS